MAQDGRYRMIPRTAVEDFLGSEVPFDWIEVYMPTFDAAMALNLDAGAAVFASIGGGIYKAKQCNKNGTMFLAGDAKYNVPDLTRVDIAEILKRMPMEDNRPHPLRAKYGVPLENIVVGGSYIGPERRQHPRAYQQA